ncbi:hypothetical protein FTX61_20570 [Nitriliruptoraceae bacterium ZYF776]|nr:hypothetical protein [Profundirhabdus halotolerans]
MKTLLRRLADAAPVRVFTVAGIGAREAVQDLRLDPRVRVVASPRQGNLLLLAGGLTEALRTAAVAAHDAMPPPRGVVMWTHNREAPTGTAIPGAVVATGPEIVATLVTTHRALLSGERDSTPPVQPDVDPAPWRGEGPYGQGGSGMTGGVPYGRPMATREDDRDGLSLDALPVPVGPLFSGFPDGLTARVTFKGDLVHRFELGPNPFVTAATTRADDPFIRALEERVAIAVLEQARARALLRWTADALRLHGLDALAVRVLSLAGRAGPEHVATVRRLRRWITRSVVTGWQTRRVGHLETTQLVGLGAGPVSRAAGVSEDLRADDPVYQRLGFVPIRSSDGDVAARWQQRLIEAEQALELAGRAGELVTGGQGEIESPRGRLALDDSPTGRLLELVPDLVTGVEWGDAVATLASLDLDLPEVAAVTTVPTGRPR